MVAHNLLYKSKLPEAVTITADELATAPAEMAIDGKLFTSWRPPSTTPGQYWRAVFEFSEAVAMDMVAIAGQYLSSADKVQVDHSPDGVTWTNALNVGVQLKNTWAYTFTSATKKYWRFSVDAGSGNTIDTSDYIGVLYMGEALNIPRISAPVMGFAQTQGFDSINNLSETGLFLGRSNYFHPVPFSFKLQNYDPVWIRANIPDFMTEASEKPFFFQWDSDTVTGRTLVAYCWTDGRIDPPQYSSVKFMDFAIKGYALRVTTSELGSI